MIEIPIIDLASAEGQALIKEIELARTDRNDEVDATVKAILNEVATRGDEALFEFSAKFDKRELTAANIRLTKEYITEQSKLVPADLADSIREAAKRIEAYHSKQKFDTSFSMETLEGTLSQMVLPLNRVALYVPGGHTVYPSTVLMTAIPAKIAGVNEMVVLTPCRNGLEPVLASVFELLEIDEVYQIGGAQAVAAVAYGTDSIPQVDKVVGPGNSYVAAAKKQVYGLVDIDSIAGPSDVAIMADETTNPTWAALDLLSQAEHGSGDETAFLVTESREVAKNVHDALMAEIENSPRKEIFEKLSPNAITLFVAESRDKSIAFVNRIAPEHLEIMTSTYKDDLKKIRNAAAIFLGQHSPVPLGDYFIGTNHVLPTGGASRYASPLGVDSFRKRISVAEITRDGIESCSDHLSRFARSEEFVHHAIAVERRVGK